MHMGGRERGSHGGERGGSEVFGLGSEMGVGASGVGLVGLMWRVGSTGNGSGGLWRRMVVVEGTLCRKVVDGSDSRV